MDLRDGSQRRVMTPPSVGRMAIKWFDVGPDGRSLYMIARPQGGGPGNNLVAADAETGVMRVIGTARAVTASLSVSPDGTQLAFLARDDTSGHVELRVIPTTGSGSSRTVFRPDRGQPGPPVTWMPDGSGLVFKIQTGEQASLWSISVRGGEPVRLLSDCCAENRVRIHPDGSRLAFASGRDRGEIWILKIPGTAGRQRPRD